MGMGEDYFGGRPAHLDPLPDGFSESSGAIIQDDDALSARDPAQDRPADLPNHRVGPKLSIPLFQGKEGHPS